MKKKLLSALMAASMAAGLVGCAEEAETETSASSSSSGSTTSTASASEGSVYWLNFKPEADTALQKIAQTYTDQTGVEVKVVTAASGTYDSTLTSEMDKSSAPTMFVVGSQTDLNRWADYVVDLNGTSLADELNTDAYNLYTEDGKLGAVAYCYESFGIIVNKALLKEAGYELSDITNFETLKAVVEDIHARADELGFDAFTSSGMDPASSWRFTGHLLNVPLYYESVDDGGWTEAPAEIKGTYVNLFKNVYDLYVNNAAVDKGTLATGGYDAEAEFGRGEAVFYQNGTWEWSALTGEDGYAMNPDDLAMIPIYSGYEGEENAGLNSGTGNYWAVNSKASEADQKATIDFMTWLVTSEEGTEMLAQELGPIPYKNAVEPENVFFANATQYAAEGKYTMTWATSFTPNVDEFRAGLVAALNQYNAGGDWANVETAIIQGWAIQYQAANAE